MKVTQLSKDMNMKSKEVLEVLAEKGIALKSSSSLETEHFELLLDTLTRNNQIDNIGNYLDGVTYIPSKSKSAVKKASEASAEVTDKKAEMPKTETAEAAVKADDKSKKEVKAEAKTEVKAEEKARPEPKTAQKSAAEETKQAVAEAPKAEARPEPKEEPVKQERPAEVKTERVAPAKPAPERNDRQTQGYAPRNDQRNDQRNDFRPRNNAPQGGYAQGAQRPQGAQGAGAPYRQGQNSGAYGEQRQGQGRFGDSQQGGRFGAAAGGAQQNNRFGNNGQRPQGQSNNRGFGGQSFDKEDNNRKHVPTFKPEVIVREQTKKGDTAPKTKGATRLVDMRAGEVDLSKYDDKLNTFVSDSVADARGGTQRVKKQAPAKGAQQNTFGKGKDKFKGKKSTQPVTKAPTSVTLPDEIMVSDLASRLKVTSAEVVKRLMMLGMMVTVNQTVDYDTAAIVAEEMGISATKEVVVTIEERLFDEEEDSDENLVGRAPVVCVMGHVDHGKTSILDAIRHTNVTTGEAGGITQHIGAYRVKAQGQDITFLDTPGHEAFTAMRARGAQATDIAILVVAADDGIMPQTIEAINHAKAAGIDIIVAINKMDKPTANPDNVKQELTKYDLVPEEWGGDVICVPVSALTGYGISDLLENVLLVAEVKELKANPKRRAKGIVIEAKLDKGRGPVATVLVQNGTLHSGDIVIAGTSVGRVRAMTDHNGRNLKEAGPSVPVEIIGLAEVPASGDEFNAVADERMARELADQRREKVKEETFKANARANLNDLFAQISEGVKQLNIIVKADVGGSAEAVKQSLEKISNDEVKVCVIHAAAGGIREGDVTFAAASNAIIVGFNVRPDKVAIDSAERQNVEIRTYRVIYDCINEITDAMKGMLAPEFKEVLLGHAEVRQTIHVPNVGTIAGSYVQDGKVTRAAMIRVVRDGVVIFEDKISSLRRFKDDVKEVAQSYECGIGLERFNDIKVGDVLEAYVMEEIKR